MKTRLTEPGLYDIPFADYQADPAPEPSLRSSMIAGLLDQTPADVALGCKSLTADDDADGPDESTQRGTSQQRLGTLIHGILLGVGGVHRIVDATDWRTKAAKEARAEAEEAGSIAVLRHEWAQAEQIAAAAMPKLRRLFGGWPIGESEQTVLWRRETAHGPIWCRALLDHYDASAGMIVDLKTTSLAVDDTSLAKSFASYGHAYQAAFHTEGVESLALRMRGRVQFRWAVISVVPPFHVRRIALPRPWLDMAARRIDRAADTFAACLRSGEWPGYPASSPADEAILQMPGWLEREWLAQELNGETA